MNEPFGDKWDKLWGFQGHHSLSHQRTCPSFCWPVQALCATHWCQFSWFWSCAQPKTLSKGWDQLPLLVESSSEKNYPVHQLEFLALKWAVVDTFHDYSICTGPSLWWGQITTLTYIVTTDKLNFNWSPLACCSVDIQLHSLVSTKEAATLILSHCHATPFQLMQLRKHMPPESVKAVCKQISCGKSSEGSLNYAKPLGISPVLYFLHSPGSWLL